MPNIFQQVLQDIVGTAKGEAIEAEVQPALNTVTSTIIGAVTAESPTAQAILTLAQALGAKVSTGSAPTNAPVASTGQAPTPAQIVTILNSTLTTLGLPTTDDAAFDSAFQTAYTAAGFTLPAANPT